MAMLGESGEPSYVLSGIREPGSWKGWRLVWCHERCHKLENKDRRNGMEFFVNQYEGALVSLKKAKALGRWASFRDRESYILVTDWREAQPCVAELSKDSMKRPATWVVLCDSPLQVRRATNWSWGVEAEICRDIHVIQGGMVPEDLLGGLLYRCFGGPEGLPLLPQEASKAPVQGPIVSTDVSSGGLAVALRVHSLSVVSRPVSPEVDIAPALEAAVPEYEQGEPAQVSFIDPHFYVPSFTISNNSADQGGDAAYARRVACLLEDDDVERVKKSEVSSFPPGLAPYCTLDFSSGHSGYSTGLQSSDDDGEHEEEAANDCERIANPFALSSPFAFLSPEAMKTILTA